MQNFSLLPLGVNVKKISRNLPPAILYKKAIQFQPDTSLNNTGAIVAYSGKKTGRSPKDKRIAKELPSEKNVWWGDVNIPISPSNFQKNRQIAIDFLNSQPELFVFDGFAGWDKNNQIKIRVICSLPYHALFMHNMLIRPSTQELLDFGQPDYVLFNAGSQPADPSIPDVSSSTSVNLSFEKKEFIILGSNYAGEMKKGVFTILNYLMPEKNILSMHCSANQGPDNDVSLFFGLSGTGKTTLSADSKRYLIGDDEHCWNNHGIFNIEGGCYAKCINLSQKKEPEIFQAIRFGTILENVLLNPNSAEVLYDNRSITENTRASYPLEFIPNVKIPAVAPHPNNIIFLTCDAFGVLPPVMLLSPAAASYHFISGYTAKVAGTEIGVTEPQANFSACFGAPFLVWHPNKYAAMLAEKMIQFKTNAWLINTGWCGGPYGTGSRIDLKYTRSIIDAIHNGSLLQQKTHLHPFFNQQIPKNCPNIPPNLLDPIKSWQNPEAYQLQAEKLVRLFIQNFKPFEKYVSNDVLKAAPLIPTK